MFYALKNLLRRPVKDGIYRLQNSRRLLAAEFRNQNLGCTADRPILLVHHHRGNPRINDAFVGWMNRNFPVLLGQFEFGLLPITPASIGKYSAVIFWIQDPVEQWSEKAYSQCLALEKACEEKGIPLINPPSRYANRVEAGNFVRAAGLTMPDIEAIDNLTQLRSQAESLRYPFLVRNAQGHAVDSPMVYVSSPSDLGDPLIDRMKSPIKMNWMDVQDQETKLYWKYRVIVLGDKVIPHHLQITPNRITRGDARVIEDWAKSEELDYIRSPVEQAEQFRIAARNFGLDYLAFDYGIDQEGDIVVWEANPYPFVRFSGPKRQGLFRAEAIHRTYAATLHMYLKTAGMEAPAELDTLISHERAIFEPAVSKLQVVIG